MGDKHDAQVQTRKQRKQKAKDKRDAIKQIKMPMRGRQPNYKIACPVCEGSGKVIYSPSTVLELPESEKKRMQCPMCEGQQYMWASKRPHL